MSPASDYSVQSPPFVLHAPAEQRVPFVFNSPHSGRVYPQRFLEQSRLDSVAIRRSEDCFVDELYAGVVPLGAPLLAANFPRAYLDVNREPWELDPRMFYDQVPPHANIRSARVAGGLGTVPRIVGEGAEIYRHRLPLAEATDRIDFYYRPYHETLKSLLMTTRQHFGYAALIDCHSMPASIKISDSGRQPDFIIGDRFGSSAAHGLTHRAIALLDGMGYAVAHNKPYAGGFITEHYGRPGRGLHAIQIEINRGLYMNERTLEPKAGFATLQANLTQFASDLMATPDSCFGDHQIAAE